MLSGTKCSEASGVRPKEPVRSESRILSGTQILRLRLRMTTGALSETT